MSISFFLIYESIFHSYFADQLNLLKTKLTAFLPLKFVEIIKNCPIGVSIKKLKNALSHEVYMSEENAQTGSGDGAVTKNKKFLTFSLADEKYGIPLSTVKEVIGMVDITPVPHVPNFFKGLINLRGKIISIIDLRIKLGLPKTEMVPKKTTIVITEIDDLTLGAIVDDVQEVVGFEKDQVENSIDVQSKVSREFVTGVAKTNTKKLILLLDIGKTLSVSDLALIKKQA